LRAMRLRGWDSTSGQVTPGVTGVAAAVLDSNGTVLGSLSLTVRRRAIPPAELDALAERVRFCAGIVSGAVARS
jgi:DNA-binding IclR family transcriptional regulator